MTKARVPERAVGALTRLTLTRGQFAQMEALSPLPVRNAGLVRLVDEHEARPHRAADEVSWLPRVWGAIALRWQVIKRYGLFGAAVKVLYWKCEWAELLHRTERMFWFLEM